MSGREPPRRSDPDDWFSDPDRLSWGSTTAVEPPAAPHDESDATEDWLYGDPVEPPPDRPDPGFTVKLGTLLVAAAVVVALLALAGLWLGGAFSSGGNHPPTSPPTTASTTATSRTPTTTPTTPTRPALPAPTSTLKPGDQGVQVKRLQRALVRLGYSTGAVDGDYGPSTQAALTRFQKASKLTADGVLGPTTLSALKKALRQLP